jgi:branched-subunit amino acid transport protein AzlD
MALLHVYLLRDARLAIAPNGAVHLVPVVVTAAVCPWRRHMLLATCAGTITNALLLIVARG